MQPVLVKVMLKVRIASLCEEHQLCVRWSTSACVHVLTRLNINIWSNSKAGYNHHICIRIKKKTTKLIKPETLTQNCMALGNVCRSEINFKIIK